MLQHPGPFGKHALPQAHQRFSEFGQLSLLLGIIGRGGQIILPEIERLFGQFVPFGKIGGGGAGHQRSVPWPWVICQ